MKKEIVIIVSLLIICILLNGCLSIFDSSHPDKTKFVGTWGYETHGNLFNNTYFLHFYSDNTYYGTLISHPAIIGSEGFWDIKDGEIIFTEKYSQNKRFYTYIFSDNNTNLSLIDPNGQSAIYIKQKK